MGPGGWSSASGGSRPCYRRLSCKANLDAHSVAFSGLVLLRHWHMFLEDACMAMFNVPIRRDDPVGRAVTAARELQRAVEKLRNVMTCYRWVWALARAMRRLDDWGLTTLRNTRPLGTASRLQGRAGPGEVLVTSDVYEAVVSMIPDARRRECEL